MNDGFFMKLVWEMFANPDSLWAKVLNGKYGRAANMHDVVKVVNGDSNL